MVLQMIPTMVALAAKAATAAKAAGAVKTVMSVANLASTAMTAGGQLMQGSAQRRQGEAEYQAALAEAVGIRQNASIESAASAHQVGRIGAEGRRVSSEHQTGAAASGFQLGDQTSMEIAGNIAGKTRIQQLIEAAKGEDAFRAGQYNADLTVLRGEQARKAGRQASRMATLAAGATVIQGVSSWRDKFGNPKKAPKVTSGKSVTYAQKNALWK